MELRDEIKQLVEQKKDEFFAVSDKIWGYAETRFEEFQSAACIEAALEK